MSQLNKISPADFEELTRILYDHSGIHIEVKKQSLLPARLKNFLQENNYRSYSEYINRIKKDSSGRMVTQLLNLMSTNLTFFNREKDHFEYFQNTVMRNIMQYEEKRESKDLRIWSAGCSSGEEAYFLVMLMIDKLGISFKNWETSVLATDISKRVLDFAEKGIYPDERMLYVPEKFKRLYFRQKGDDWHVRRDLRKEVNFAKFNLNRPIFPFKKKFHVIFCRNVMIYFDNKTRNKLVERFVDYLEPGGYFFIGHSETIRNSTSLEYVMPAAYRKKG